MVVNQTYPHVNLTPSEERASRALVTGTGTEALAAAGGVILSILALVGVVPGTLAAIALIVLGIGIFMESAAVGGSARIISQEAVTSRFQQVELVGGLSLSMMCAVAVVALGILALLGIAPDVLLGAAVVTLGACGILASGETEVIGHFEPAQLPTTHPMSRTFEAEAPAGLELLGGVAAVVLGILALTGVNTPVMILTGILVISAALFLSGVALTRRLAGFLGS